MMRRNVVLPQPDGPSNTMNSPSGTVRLMPFDGGDLAKFLDDIPGQYRSHRTS